MAYPAAVRDHQAQIGRLTLALLLAIRRLWARLELAGPWEEQYAEDIGPKIYALTLATQAAVTAQVDTHMARILNELAFGPPVRPGVLPSTAFTGLTGDGRSVDTLLSSSVGRARASESLRRSGEPLAPTAPSTEEARTAALVDGERFMALVASSVIADTARAAENAAMGARPFVDGWIRVISPPCCSRCAVLTGRFYLWNEGFDRHPGCDCKHMPAPAAGPARDRLITAESPERYFDSLDRAEQDRIFTRDGAAAIRAGADISQVVNARRGMTTAGESNTRAGLTAAGEETRVNTSIARAVRTDVNGRMVFTTTEGTTRRGRARTGVVRLMPESLAQIAGDDREEFVRLLRLNGFIS